MKLALPSPALAFAVYFFLTSLSIIQPSLSRPDDSPVPDTTDNNAADAPLAKQNFVVPKLVWNIWYFENHQTITKISKLLELFAEGRRNICPLGPAPSSDYPQTDNIPPRNSLRFLLRSLRRLALTFRIVTASSFAGPGQEGYKEMTLQERADSILQLCKWMGWDCRDSNLPQIAMERCNTLLLMLSTLTDLYIPYKELDDMLSDPKISNPAGTGNRESAVVSWATTMVVADASIGNNLAEGKRIKVNTKRRAKRLRALAESLNIMVVAIQTVKNFKLLAEKMGMDNDGYTAILFPASEYDPFYAGRPGAGKYTVSQLFGDFEQWFDCWRRPLYNLIWLIRQLTAFPGVQGWFSYDLGDEPLTVDEMGLVDQALGHYLASDAPDLVSIDIPGMTFDSANNAIIGGNGGQAQVDNPGTGSAINNMETENDATAQVDQNGDGMEEPDEIFDAREFIIHIPEEGVFGGEKIEEEDPVPEGAIIDDTKIEEEEF
ncbi:hypothetical protein TWF281_003800 [Arthrobotrys megalospora]